MTGTLTLLQEFYREKLAALLRHQAGARVVAQYDQNNTYQFIVTRDETQLSWVGKAIEEMGGGPMKATPMPVMARAKSAFSLKNP